MLVLPDLQEQVELLREQRVVVFEPQPEDIETYLIRMFDLLDQVPQALRWTDREACFVVRCCETVDANFYSRITRHSNHAPICVLSPVWLRLLHELSPPALDRLREV